MSFRVHGDTDGKPWGTELLTANRDPKGISTSAYDCGEF